MAAFPRVTDKREQEGEVIRCDKCNAVAYSNEEAVAAQFVNVRFYNSRGKGEGRALEKRYSLCSNCHSIMKQRLIEGSDIGSFFSPQSPTIMKNKAEELGTNKEDNKEKSKAA
jgi:hypothetical protein